jgi:hypothetical protein
VVGKEATFPFMPSGNASIPTLGTSDKWNKIMDEIIEEDPKKDEKKAFYVGLATVLGLVIIIFLTIFFIRGCSGTKKDIKEVQDNSNKDKGATQTAAAVTTPTQASVAGASTAPQTTSQVKGQTYTVQSGDTLYDIGKKFKVSWQRIAEANGIDNSGALKVGSQIIIPSQ